MELIDRLRTVANCLIITRDNYQMPEEVTATLTAEADELFSIIRSETNQVTPEEQHKINQTDLKEMALYYGGWEKLKKVIHDLEVSEAEAAHESFVNDFYGGPSPQQSEQHRLREAQKLKH